MIWEPVGATGVHTSPAPNLELHCHSRSKPELVPTVCQARPWRRHHESSNAPGTLPWMAVPPQLVL